jgi:2-polyprenyl-6-methoxyphenol hydroxylase-like FAD-dependent oxidoreductase
MTTTADTATILVVGAGPTGLLLAAELARRGAPVRIVEKRAARCAESRALSLHSRTLEMLDSIGLAEEFLACGHPVRAICLYAGTRLLMRTDFRRLDSRFRFMLDIPQNRTERLLRQHLEGLGVHVEHSTEVLGLTQDAGGADVVVRRPDGDTECIRAAYVVGCDGAHSTVRARIGMPFEGHPYLQDWLLADVALDWDRTPEEMHAIFNPAGRPAVCLPMGEDGRWRVFLPFAGERGGERRAPTLDEIAELVARRVPDRVRVSDPTWLSTFRIQLRSAPGYRRGRVLLAGDAVHVHSPAGGQGMNTGLLDACNLGWKLAAVAGGSAAEALLDTYQPERAPVARDVLGLTHSLVRLGTMSARWQRAARAVLLPVASRLPTVPARAARRLSQQYVGYRSSPLTVAGGAGRGLRPGDRAPDATVDGTDGPIALHELLRDPRHTLLLVGDEPSAAPDRYGAYVRTLRVAGADVLRRYGAGSMHLVRPDGYLAASGSDSIRAYLERVYAPAGRPSPAVSTLVPV